MRRQSPCAWTAIGPEANEETKLRIDGSRVVRIVVNGNLAHPSRPVIGFDRLEGDGDENLLELRRVDEREKAVQDHVAVDDHDVDDSGRMCRSDGFDVVRIDERNAWR